MRTDLGKGKGRMMKRIIAVVTALALMAGILAAIPGCGPNNEELIRQAVTEKYDAYKNADDAALSKIVTSLENDGLAELGIDETEFVSAIVDGFDYNIDAVAVTGDTAKVTMTFAGKSYTDLLSKIAETTATLANDPTFTEMSQEERLSKAGQMVMDSFNNLEIKNETVDLDYELVDNKWQEADQQAGLDQIDNILFAK